MAARRRPRTIRTTESSIKEKALRLNCLAFSSLLFSSLHFSPPLNKFFSTIIEIIEQRSGGFKRRSLCRIKIKNNDRRKRWLS